MVERTPHDVGSNPACSGLFSLRIHSLHLSVLNSLSLAVATVMSHAMVGRKLLAVLKGIPEDK